MPQTQHILLTLDEAAAFLRMSPQDLRAMTVAGELPCHRFGERLQFEQKELDLWLSQRLVEAGKAGRKLASGSKGGSDFSLLDYCRENCVSCHLPGKTKPAVLKALVELADGTGFLYNPDDLLEQLRQREEQGSTAMSSGIALVHPAERDEYLFEEPFLCLARAVQPVFFGETDGLPTDIFFLIASTDSDLHIKMLARICRLCELTNLLTDLRAAESSEEMLDALRHAEAHPAFLKDLQ